VPHACTQTPTSTSAKQLADLATPLQEQQGCAACTAQPKYGMPPYWQACMHLRQPLLLLRWNGWGAQQTRHPLPLPLLLLLLSLLLPPPPLVQLLGCVVVPGPGGSGEGSSRAAWHAWRPWGFRTGDGRAHGLSGHQGPPRGGPHRPEGRWGVGPRGQATAFWYINFFLLLAAPAARSGSRACRMPLQARWRASRSSSSPSTP